MDSDAARKSWPRENGVQSGTTTMGWEIRGVPKHQGMRLQDLVHNWEKGNEMLESARAEVGCLCGAARHDGLRLQACQNKKRETEAMPT